MIRKALFCLTALLLLLSCGQEDDHDMEKPEIDMSGVSAFPLTCDVVYRGDSFTFKALLTDNRELGNYNIEIHNNFDHHSHSTDDVDCEPDEKKTPVNPFIYNESFRIPDGMVSYQAESSIHVPDDVDTGDYHFMIRLTDKSGWQQLKAVGIKVRDRN
ncbi:DUF4625 domain-containing protein [Proteiniphilum acetatigenes]|uniref:DUF4625 domain-containing protein n=1 Tax=Proteiniphilum acetatigenes TaxID=294710 RepID=UPI000379FD31|nr:DUF4625 domain-containing protein [Proteiniphilum acetatigenes]SFL20396.1 protein of unknown function [Porphyromonadaceae bacterium KH3CP3RA]